MANKPSLSRQHKHLAVLIDADNASVAITIAIESSDTMDKLRVAQPTDIQLLTNPYISVYFLHSPHLESIHT
ncbi:hypothetical protein N619_04380 [Ectopseudomonas oleovorans]|nr:hypothetical protein N619_04345 [Pseudomonas oleovorans]KJU80678.1 hypothetical protein N619_04355 [Pseudomonas oleovorans]KJU80682.1 hypothetical protein N619_04380 [Pseudomonas oleovorans]